MLSALLNLFLPLRDGIGFDGNMTKGATGRHALGTLQLLVAVAVSLSAARGTPSHPHYGHIAENSPSGSPVDGVKLPLVGGDCRGAHLLLDRGLTGNYASDFKLFFHRGQRHVGLKSTKTLDREFIAIYEFRVTLPGCLKGPAAVQVEVADQNDNAPEFTGGNKTVKVNELTLVGTEVARVIAKDSDAEMNGQVTYFARPKSHLVHVVPSSGQVTLVRSLMGVTAFTLHVYAKDNGDPVLISDLPLRLQFEVARDGWDKSPSRRPRAVSGEEIALTVNVSDDVKVGDLIFTVPDQKFAKRWFEVVSEPDSPVQIERDSGRLYLAHALRSPTDVVVKIQNVRGEFMNLAGSA